MIKFFAVIGFIYYITTVIAFSYKGFLSLRNHIRFKKLLSKTDMKEIIDMINKLPNKIDSPHSYEELVSFCNFMLMKFPGNSLWKLNKYLNKHIGKEFNMKLQLLLISCDEYINSILSLINVRLKQCVNGEFNMTQKHCDDVRSYVINLQEEVNTIAVFEHRFKNK